MALSALIRKASPSVALRVIGSSITTLNNSISRSFSSVETGRDLADANLYAILERRIETAESNLKNLQANTPPDSLPYKTESRMYLNERLEIYCKFHDDREFHIYIDWSNVNNKEFETKTPSIPIGVRFGPFGNRLALRFDVIVSPEDMIIQSFSVFHEEKKRYLGCLDCSFKDLNYELQQSLYKYLETEGINSNMANFAIKTLTMEKKENDLRVLKNVKNVIRKRNLGIMCSK